MRLTLLYNPTAGDEEHSAETLTQLLVDAGHEVADCRSVKESGWSAALGTPTDLVVVAGGDGSVRRVFKELAVATRPAPATLVPTGSANNIARTLGYRDEPVRRLLRRWKRLRPGLYDVGELSASSGATRFVESAGGGIFADALARAERSDVDLDGEEKLDRGLELLREAIAEAPAFRCALEVDDVDLTGDLLAVELLNIREIGPNVALAPEAAPGDGQLDVVQVREEHRAALTAYIDDRLSRRRPEPLRLPVQRGSRITMQLPDGCPLHVDDQPWPTDKTDGRGPVVVTPGGRPLELLLP